MHVPQNLVLFLTTALVFVLIKTKIFEGGSSDEMKPCMALIGL
jgi:hypothetical protein